MKIYDEKIHIHKTIDTAGYVLVKVRDHPFAQKSGYIPEHRLIMERHIGRYLTDDELVHHINHDKVDNRIENLKIMNRSKHIKTHKKGVKLPKKYSESKVLELYKSGYSARDIAKITGIGKSTVTVYVKENNLSRPQMTVRDELGRFAKVVNNL